MRLEIFRNLPIEFEDSIFFYQNSSFCIRCDIFLQIATGLGPCSQPIWNNMTTCIYFQLETIFLRFVFYWADFFVVYYLNKTSASKKEPHIYRPWLLVASVFEDRLSSEIWILGRKGMQIKACWRLPSKAIHLGTLFTRRLDAVRCHFFKR